MAKVLHDSRGLLLRRGRFAYDIEVFRPDGIDNDDASEWLPQLDSEPRWTAGSSQSAVLKGKTIPVFRLDTPPAAHFSREPRLIVTTVSAIMPAAETTDVPGSWIPAGQLADSVDDQWGSVFSAIISQIQYALSAGYIRLKASPAKLSRPLANTVPRDSGAAGHSKGESSSSIATASAESIWAAHHDKTFAFGSTTAQEMQSSQTKVDDNEPIAQQDEPQGFMTGGTGVHIGCSDYPREEVVQEEVEECSTCGSEHEAGQEGDRGSEAASTPRAALTWQPGQIAEVQAGGRDVQAILDSEGLKLGIIHWHAAWVEACIDVVPFLQRLAARFEGLAVMQLNVEASMENKLLAYEKVLTRSESRRRGAKPVVKNGGNFPCITVHQPCNSLPAQTLCGSNAIDRLAEILATRAEALRSREPTSPAHQSSNPGQQISSNAADKPAALLGHATSKRASTGNVASPKFSRQSNVQPAPNTKTSSANSTEIEEKAGPPATESTAEKATPENGHMNGEELGTAQSPITLRNGAMQFKQLLKKGEEAKQKVVLVWQNEATPISLDKQAALDQMSPALYLQALTVGNRHNQQLASALGIKSLPSIQVYEGMRLIKNVSGSRISYPEADAAAPKAKSESSPAESASSQTAHRSAATQDGNTFGSEPDVQKASTPQPDSQPPSEAASSKHHESRLVPNGSPERSGSAKAETQRAADVPSAQPHVSLPVKASSDVNSTVPKGESFEQKSPDESSVLPAKSQVATSIAAQSSSSEKGEEWGTVSATISALDSKARDETYDPPRKAGKAGDKKRLPKGIGIYWPKMPCLRCGCPWWLGEDWDAKCARCSWTAEADGYDDDSRPLPKFKKKYAHFTALLKEGRTHDWKESG